MDTTATLQAVRTLPLEDRLEFLFQAWDELIADGWKPGIDDELKAELDRRWANYKANPSTGMTWEEVVAHVRRPR